MKVGIWIGEHATYGYNLKLGTQRTNVLCETKMCLWVEDEGPPKLRDPLYGVDWRIAHGQPCSLAAFWNFFTAFQEDATISHYRRYLIPLCASLIEDTYLARYSLRRYR